MRASPLKTASWLGGLLVALLATLLGLDHMAVGSTTLEVVNPAESGPGTLRQALLDATSGDTITFSPSVFPPDNAVPIPAKSTFRLTTNNVTVDASDAGVTLNGSEAPSGTYGFIIEGDNCVIQGLTIQRFGGSGMLIAAGATGNTIGGDRSSGAGSNGQGNLIVLNGANGIEIRGDGNSVQGNYVGVDASGRWASGNAANGVALWEGASSNTIGGTSSGYRNVIGGNDENGVWIGGAGTDQNVVIGNYVGTRADGMGSVTNDLSGVAIQGGAQRNRVGGTLHGEPNVISGNSGAGVYISDSGTDDNLVLGNTIGPNWQGSDVIGQGDQGVVITAGASGNKIGNGSETGGNTISGNPSYGVLIRGADTVSNSVQGNYIGTNADGDARLANGEEGIRIDTSAHHNDVRGNVISGNGSGGYGNGVVIIDEAHHNVVSGNLIGTDRTGSFAIGGQPGGGIDLAVGAHHNIIGGPTAADRNVISGNGVDGIFISGSETVSNTVQGNYIGTDASGAFAIPNTQWGLFILDGAPGNLITGNLISGNTGHGLEITHAARESDIISNTISDNGGAGIHVTNGASLHEVTGNTITGNEQAGVLIEDGCARNTLSNNSIHDNRGQGIQLNGAANGGLPAPQLTVVATDTITGKAVPNARVEFFSDDDDEGRHYEGFAVAGGGGEFVFSPSSGFIGPNVTATTTDADGNTSQFSQPAHLSWTLLLYLNGDNDLDEFIREMPIDIVAAGPSPRANVLALVDGYTTTTTYSGTVLYDLTRGQTTPITAALTSTMTVPGELNMGDGETLAGFVTWGQAHYPARQTMLAIVDHGGGWAPSGEAIPGVLFNCRRSRLAGNSGLSWDFSNGYDYLDSREIREAMTEITDGGADPLDVVFYDACLMGMLEVAYEIKDYGSFFVSSQNIGWAPAGPEGRYVRAIQGLEPNATARQMAELLVDAYAAALPPREHPFTISAVDLASLPDVAASANQLATAISETLSSPDQPALLQTVYSETQKLDYDSDFYIEPATDGFVDLYDLALRASQRFSDADVVTAAQALNMALDTAIVAEEHRSGGPWLAPDRVWDLDNVHGLSIFLPLGEDLELPIVITETSPITPGVVVSRHLRLREMYSGDQLRFVADTQWGALIDTYYDVISSPVPTGTTEGPVDGPQQPDVTPPQTIITATGTFQVGEVIAIEWSATDTQTSVESATLWHRNASRGETAVMTQTGSSGVFSLRLTLSEGCASSFSVRAVDQPGNREPFNHGANVVTRMVDPCILLPVVMREKG